MKRPSDIVIRRVLNEKATEEEAAEVAAWFTTEQGQTWLSKEMDKDADEFAQGVATLLDGIPTEELMQRIDHAIDRSHRHQLWFRVAAVLIPCMLVIAAWLHLNSRFGEILFSTPATEEVSAQRGERKEILFQDGTKAFLNAGTRLSYPQQFGLTERRVVLDGEAYFEVRPNAKRPFVVQAGDAAVKVFGTSFNVKAYATEPRIHVVLIDGKVEFSHGEKQYPMAPSQKLVFDKNDKKIHIYAVEHADRSILWRKDILVFRDTPLREVISTLERWYDVKFEVSDTMAYNSTFSLQTPQLPLPELLGEMQNISDVRFETENKTVKVHLKK